MHKRLPVWAFFLLLIPFSAYAQSAAPDTSFRRHFIGSSAFMLANLFPDKNPPAFIQLNYGYWLSKKDVLSVEAKTWQYRWPLGIPYGPSFQADPEEYPGRIKSFGLGVAYQRYFWKGLYAATHATGFLQRYYVPEKPKPQNGFQLFLTLRTGYHVRLFRDRFFVEPSVAATHWPVNTNVPAGFAQREAKWNNYFLFEPGLHFGVKF